MHYIQDVKEGEKITRKGKAKRKRKAGEIGFLLNTLHFTTIKKIMSRRIKNHAYFTAIVITPDSDLVMKFTKASKYFRISVTTKTLIENCFAIARSLHWVWFCLLKGKHLLRQDFFQ